MDRYICLHGHFYQPPRENPWLESIEVQDSAWPFHDWNERVSAECYRTNAAARVLDSQGRIRAIQNNYARISYNVGPTLLGWLEENDPDTYRAILDADRLSARRFGGHGSAMAQAYNHLILPLANHRDRLTQVRWGIADFEERFARRPEGMWLPETAVDTETLEILAAEGIRFTVLAPSQARRVRRLGDRRWTDVTGARIDPSRAYVQRLPSGRSIALFFYDGPVSRAVAFEGLLDSGERLAGRVASLFDDRREHAQLAHIATDGETYGHHHRHGEMALAYALEHIEKAGLGRLTNYGEFLERHPPEWEVEILDATAWSCAHGVERWRSDCGCSTGAEAGWNQAWRTPLREALDWLRDALAPRYESAASALLRDPWAARDAYVAVVLDRSPDRLDRFWSEQAGGELSPGEQVRALKLLELQRHAMLMYTSCGWFFADLSGIETVQVLQYAGRAVQLARELFGEDLESPFLERLSRAHSNLAARGDGRQLYERHVRPAQVDLAKVAAHWAISRVFEDADPEGSVFCYRVREETYQDHAAGRAKLALGRIEVRSAITGEAARLEIGVLHFGDQNLSAGVRSFESEAVYDRMAADLSEAFERADLAETVRRLDHHFGARPYALASLFRDEQRAILDRILETPLGEAEAAHRRLFEAHAPLMRFVDGLGAPIPRALKTAAEFVVNHDLRDALTAEEVDWQEVSRWVATGRRFHVDLDTEGLAYIWEASLERMAGRLRREPAALEELVRLREGVEHGEALGWGVDLFRIQNLVWDFSQRVLPEQRSRAQGGVAEAAEWVAQFDRLARAVRVDTAAAQGVG